MKANRRPSVRMLTIAMAFAIAFTFMPVLSGEGEADAASKTKKMTVYSQCLKKGNYVYCMVDGGQTAGLYRVNLKTSKATRMMKYMFGEGGDAGNMSYKNGYLYYTIHDDMTAGLFRIKTSGKEKKRLASLAFRGIYAISGSTLYYYEFSFSNTENGVIKKMKLNGKSKKRARGYRIKRKICKTNAKGYSIVKKYKNRVDEDRVAYKYYLRKPNGKLIYLDTHNDWNFL